MNRENFKLQLDKSTPITEEIIKEMMSNRRFKSQKARYEKYMYFKSKLGEIMLFYMLKHNNNISVFSVFESELSTLDEYIFLEHKSSFPMYGVKV